MEDKNIVSVAEEILETDNKNNENDKQAEKLAELEKRLDEVRKVKEVQITKDDDFKKAREEIKSLKIKIGELEIEKEKFAKVEAIEEVKPIVETPQEEKEDTFTNVDYNGKMWR